MDGDCTFGSAGRLVPQPPSLVPAKALSPLLVPSQAHCTLEWEGSHLFQVRVFEEVEVGDGTRSMDW